MNPSKTSNRDTRDYLKRAAPFSLCELVLKRLSKRRFAPRPRKKGETNGDFFACCPNAEAHRMDPTAMTLVIYEAEDGSVRLHCADSGCGIVEILEPLGLQPSELEPRQARIQSGQKPAGAA